jgi:hypothetical protein
MWQKADALVGSQGICFDSGRFRPVGADFRKQAVT